jgi:hypothetical protein
MKKSFLFLLVLTLLPLAGWAQDYPTPTVAWKSGLTTQEYSYTALPSLDFAGDLKVQSDVTHYYGGGYHVDHTFTCASQGIGTDYPTANAAQYTYNVYASETAMTPIPLSDLVAGGSYYLRVYAKYVSTSNATWQGWPVNDWAWSASAYTTKTYNLPFTITSKPEVTVKVFAITKVWDDPFTDPSIDDFNIDPDLRQVTGATTNWNDVKDYLEFKRVENGTDVGTYYYTLSLTSVHPSYTIHIDDAGAKLNITQATNVAGTVSLENWTYGETAKTPVATGFKYGNDLAEFTYSEDDVTYTDEVPTNAGTYYVKATVPETINYTEVSAKSTFKINQRELKVDEDFTAPTAKTDVVYNETAQEIATAGEFIGKFKDEIIAAGAKFQYDGADALPTKTNVGTYSFNWTISVPTTSNFKYTTGATTVSGATIIEADITATDVTAPVGKTGLKYILDTKQQLIETGAVVAEDNNTHAAKGTAWYSVDGGTWTNDLSKVVAEHVKANNESYVVSWYIKGDANHNNYGSETTPAGTVEVAIAPVQFVLKADAVGATGLVFNNADQKLLTSSVQGGAANMPQGTTTWSLNGTALATGSTYEDVKGKNAGTYHISYTVVPKDAKYENDYLPYIKEDLPVFIDQYTLYIGAKTLTGTVEDFFDLTADPVTAKFTMFDFLKDGAFLGDVTTDAQKADILNQLIAPTQTMEEIFAASKAGSATVIVLQKVDVDPDKTPMNYKVDAATLLSENASLNITAIEAAIQADPVKATPTYNGANQELVGTPAVGYKAEAGTGSVAIGKVVYSLTEAGPYTDDLTTIVGKDAKKYTVYYKVELSEEATSLDRFYEYTGGVKFIEPEILPKDLATATIALGPVAPDNLVYNGADQKASVTVTATDLQGTENIITAEDFEETKVEYNSAEVEKLINAGTYTYTFTGKKNYTGTTTATITIAQKPFADGMFTLSKNVTYTGAPQKPTITAFDAVAGDAEKNALAETDYTFEIKDSNGNVVGIDAMKDADTYTFTFTATADGNYKNATDPTTVDWTIGQKLLAKEMFTLSSYEEEFDGTNQMPTYTFADDDPISGALVAADFTVAKTVKVNDVAVAVTEMIDADTYTFTFKATADGNYSGEVTRTFEITQATATIVEPEFIYLTYNGEDQKLVTEGTTDAVAGTTEHPAGKVEYQVTDADDKELVAWTTDYDKVVQKNAGDYKVNYKITASAKNYTNPLVTGTANVTIELAEISYDLGNIQKTWDGAPFDQDQINSLFAINHGELFGVDKYEVPFYFTLDKEYKDAGQYEFTTEYKVVFKTKEGGFDKDYPVNYDVKVGGTGVITINKKDIEDTDFTAPEAAAGLVYINNTPQNLIAEGYEVTTKYTWDGDTEGTPIGTIVFATAEDGEYSETVPQGTDADDYEVWYKVAGDKNHNDTKPAKIENSIAANASGFQLAFEDDTWTYDGVEFYPADVNAYDGKTATEPGIATDPETDYDFALTKDGEKFSGKLKDVGTYVFTYTGKGNYAGSSAEATIVITRKNIADADVTVALDEASAEYDAQDHKPGYKLTYKPEGKPALELVEAAGENANDFSVVADDEMKTGGEYTFKFTGNGNYTGTATAKFTITKRTVIAQAEDVEKVYDGYYGLAIADGKFVEVPITWGNLVPGEDEANIPVAGEGTFTADPLKKDVGTYAIVVDLDKFESKNYKVIKGSREAHLTIKAADLKVKFNASAPVTKIYGEADPDLKERLIVEGAVADEIETIKNNTVITRAEGETVGSYNVDLAANDNDVFKNYNVTLEGAKNIFVINKAKLIASLAPQTVTYTGVKAKLYDEGETLPSDQLVVNGLLYNKDLKIDDNKDVVSNIVVNIPDDAINVGDYEITIASADADNYEFEFLPATLTIEPLDISKATVTIPEQQVRVGDVAAEVIDAENFTIEFEGFYADDAAAFKVAAAGRFVEDGKIKDAADHESGLVLVAANPTIAYNYTGWETGKFVGNLIVVGGQTILLDDQQDIATTAKDDVNVTFTSRNVLQDNWNVVCLPFAVTVSEISDAFGYAAVDILNEEATDGDMHFKVVSSGIIDAGVPFIVKPTSDKLADAKSNFNQITFYGVDVKAFSANPTPVADNAGNKFCGTFMKETLIAGNGADKFWYMSKGMWKSAKNFTDAKPVTLAAYRAYIELASAEARIFVEEPDGSITAIDAIDFAKAETGEGWYTINGMKLDAAPTQKGTYIKDGKKVLVK